MLTHDLDVYVISDLSKVIVISPTRWRYDGAGSDGNDSYITKQKRIFAFKQNYIFLFRLTS